MKAFQMRLFHILILVCLLTTLSLPVSSAQALGTIYVRWNAAGSNSGTSWADAYTDLQSALGAAVSSDEIWVAKGTYKPTTGADRAATFQIESGVAVYGGFVGTEMSRNQRDPNPATNGTILSGDIGTIGGNSDNSYHVVTGSGTDNTAILDGFTITGGNANGGGVNDSGGGMYNVSGSPTLTNVTLSGNSAHWYGGGMYNNNSSPRLTNITFGGNSSDFDGGGVANDNNSSPILTNVNFSGNTATDGSGGGVANDNNSSPILSNVTFSSNSGYYGGGMDNFSSSPTLTNVTFNGNTAEAGGGVHNSNGSSPILTNVTFSSNSATNYGGGMVNDNSSSRLTNVTFSGNSATSRGGGMYNNNSQSIRNTILWGNTAPDGPELYNSGSTLAIRYSVVRGGCPAGSTCSYLVTANPLLGMLGDYGGSTQTIPLQAGSSAINTGSDTYCPATDQRGVARPIGLHCDIGAFEFSMPAPTLLSPAEDEVLYHKRPTFTWSGTPGVTRYKIQASKSSAFDVLEINLNVTNATYTPAADLGASKKYYWRVKAQANGMWSAWSETWSFTTGKPSSIPVLISPADGALVRDYTPKLDWNDSTVPIGKTFSYYWIQIASDPGFSSLVLNQITSPGDVTASALEPASELPANDTYYWHVRAHNLDGHYSSWSTVWSFRTALKPPDIVSPLDKAVDVPRQPTLDWSDVTDATGYKLVVSRHPDFSTPLLSGNVTGSIFHDTDWTITLPGNKLIYWRVKALGDNPSAWTSGSFTTVP